MKRSKGTEPGLFLVFAALAIMFLLFSYEKPADPAQLREYVGRFESVEWVRHPVGGHCLLRLQDDSVFYMKDDTAGKLNGWNVHKGTILRILAKDRGMNDPQAYEIWWKNRDWKLVSYEETLTAIRRDQWILAGVWGGLAILFCAMYFVRRQEHYEEEERNHAEGS